MGCLLKDRLFLMVEHLTLGFKEEEFEQIWKKLIKVACLYA